MVGLPAVVVEFLEAADSLRGLHFSVVGNGRETALFFYYKHRKHEFRGKTYTDVVRKAATLLAVYKRLERIRGEA